MARRPLAETQIPMFAAPPRPAIGLAPVPAEVAAAAAALPPHVRFGTSSWTFPGWTGILWDRPTTESELAADGLAAYARHPLLRTVGVDRSWYADVPTTVWRAYADAVPADFRFLVKARQTCTSLRLEGRPNPYFLDPAWALDHVIGPLHDGLGARLGVLLWPFPPQDTAAIGGPEGFAARLEAFLTAVPALPMAVEVRNRELLTRPYAAALRAAGVGHGLVVYPGMPALPTQARVADAVGGPRRVIRWMLRPDLRYEEAKSRFHPFRELAAPDPGTRGDLATIIAAAAAGQEVTVIANNKGEGSSPLSLIALALALARREGR